MRAAALLVAGTVIACGQHAAAPPTPVRHEAPPSIEATPAGPDDPVVARVDGRPVYGSCVQAQAAALGLDARAALDQCIAFELLAGAADAAGLRADPDVADAWRREMVRAVIAADLGPVDTIDDFPEAFMAPLMANQGRYLHRPTIRVSHWLRVKVPKSAVIDGPEDQAAKAAADAIVAQLAGRDGLLLDDLVAAADRVTAGTGLETEHSGKPYPTPETEDYHVRAAVKPFREALYSIPKIGQVAAPVRTEWGWDIVLWWDVWPEADLTPSFFTFARQKYFAVWADGLARAAGVTPSVDEDALAALAGEAP